MKCIKPTSKNDIFLKFCVDPDDGIWYPIKEFINGDLTAQEFVEWISSGYDVRSK